MKALPTTALPGGERVPVLGLGTWRMGEDASERRTEIAALRTGIELGMTVVDMPMSYVYAVVALGFAMMTFRAAQIGMLHWRNGWSTLERPGEAY